MVKECCFSSFFFLIVHVLSLNQGTNNVASLSVCTESLIGEVYMEKILEKLHITLSKTKTLSDEGNLQPLISFICDVTFTFFSTVQCCFSLLSAQDLLFTVFQFTAQDQSRTILTGRSCVVCIVHILRQYIHITLATAK